jgi:hypothetical protein
MPRTETLRGWVWTRRLLVVGLGLAVARGGVGAMPEWQKRVLVGKVTPSATDEGLALRPGTGFACKKLDLTKPLETQSSPDACDALSTQVYLKHGDELLPGPVLTGTLTDGLAASWAQWGAAAATWGPLALKLVPDRAGNLSMGVYTTPLEGGCLPKVAVQKPAKDPAGEGCLSRHGTYDVPLRRIGLDRLDAALAALEADESTGSPPTLCMAPAGSAPNLEGCADVRKILGAAGCDTDAALCLERVGRLNASERRRFTAGLTAIGTGVVDGGTYGRLLRMLRDDPNHLGDEATALARVLVVRTAIATFEAQVKDDDLSGAERSLENAVSVDGPGPHAARRQRLTTLQRAKAAREAAEAARAAAADRACKAGCMQMVVACDDNPYVCGGGCNYTSLCPCCNPAPNDCAAGGTSRYAYNATHPACR